MAKRIYVGLSKLNSDQLKSLARKTGISLSKLQKVAQNQATLTPVEQARITKLQELDDYP